MSQAVNSAYYSRRSRCIHTLYHSESRLTLTLVLAVFWGIQRVSRLPRALEQIGNSLEQMLSLWASRDIGCAAFAPPLLLRWLCSLTRGAPRDMRWCTVKHPTEYNMSRVILVLSKSVGLLACSKACTHFVVRNIAGIPDTCFWDSRMQLRFPQ